MKKLITLLTALLLAFSANAYTIKGTVVDVLDGDTLKIQSGNEIHKIRLAYIDAPEMAQRYGVESKNSLTMLTKNKPAIADCYERDMYGRNLCAVAVGSTVVNFTQVTRGLAWVYTFYAPKNSPLFDVQATAKKNKLGLWSDPTQTAPWDFRRAEK